MDPGNKGHTKTYAPFWGQKLSMPHYYKRDKIPKFQRHWNHRIGLEVLKINHVLKYGNNATEEEKKHMGDELAKYIDDCYQVEKEEKLRDVYVTDHSVVEQKYLSSGDDEDEDFYNYQKSLEEYNNDVSSEAVFSNKKAIYEKGSLMQKIMDPFAESIRDEEGSIVYTVEDKELSTYKLDDEAFMKAQFELQKTKAEVWDVDEEDEDAFRLAML